MAKPELSDLFALWKLCEKHLDRYCDYTGKVVVNIDNSVVLSDLTYRMQEIIRE